jgi:tight adherence protein C
MDMPLLMGLPLLVVIGVVFAVVLVAVLLFESRIQGSQTATRVSGYTSLADSSEVSVETLASRQRGQQSVVERLLGYAAVTAPRQLRSSAAADLAKARVSMSPNVFLGIRGVLLLGLPLLGLLWVLASPQRGPLQWGILGMLVLLAPRLPSRWLRGRIKANRRAIEHALPYTLDLMVACLEAGLSLEATLDRVAADSDTLLSQEIRRSLAEIALGRPSSEALRDLGDRTGAPDLRRLTESVTQAERMGVSIAEAMRTLAEESRIRRRLSAEEQARKAPIKMLPVLVLCTLPAMGAILMTPAIISLGRAVAIFHHP